MIRRRLTLGLAAALPLVWGLAGCGGGGGAGAAKTPAAPPVVKEDAGVTKSVATAGAKTEGAAAEGAEEGWGTIKGQIVFGGEAPEPAVVVKQGDPNAKDAAVCAVKGVLSEELVVNKVNKGLKWVIVSVTGKPKVHPDMKLAEGTAELGQEFCYFIPHVLAMRQGQKFLVTSNDPVAHNTKGDSFKNPPFNPIIPPGSAEEKSKWDSPNDLVAEPNPIKISCNIHPWMGAYVAVFDHPYYAVTDENGNFEIKNVPAGAQKLKIWHEKGFGEGGRDGKSITVKAGETTDLGAIIYTAK